MRYRERVSVMQPVVTKTPAGQPVNSTYAEVEGLSDVAATIARSPVYESRNQQMIVVEDKWVITLAGQYADLATPLTVKDAAGRYFDIDSVEPLLGGRQTVLTARLVESPL